MAAQLTPVEMLVREIEHMTERKKSLAASIKAEEARLADFRSQVDERKLEAKQHLESIHASLEREKVSLTNQLAPLKTQLSGLQSQITGAQTKLADIQQQTDVALTERRTKLAHCDARCQQREAALASVQDIISTLKHKVSAL